MAKKKSKTSKSLPKTTPEVRGLIFLSLAFALFLSLLSFSQGHETYNLLGLMGYSTGFFLHAAFGLSSYILCLFIGWIGWRLLFNKSLNQLALKTLYIAVFMISTSMLASVFEAQQPKLASQLFQYLYPVMKNSAFHYHLGGAPFYYIYRDLPYFSLEKALNWFGVTCLFATTWLASLLFLTKLSPLHLYYAIKNSIPEIKPIKLSFPSRSENTSEEPAEKPSIEPTESDFMRYVKLRIPQSLAQDSKAQPLNELIAIQPEQEPKTRPSMSKKEGRSAPKPQREAPALEPPARHSERSPDLNSYQLPSLSLLTNAKKVDQSNLKQNLKKQAEVLEETLMSFGIEAKVGQINCGPTINSFEVHPAVGVKVQKIKTLENDIALNMEAKSIRIIAPIPGKAAVGIEVPNPYPQEVSFKEMITAYQQGRDKFRIPILLGKAVNGDYVMSDLTKWPHCIIAGATGSGKSVCINTIIMSILLNARPDEIKLIMVDPKKVELTPYTAIPHMLAPVITEPRDACAALNWLVREMEKRYEVLKVIGVRNIDAFNNRTPNKDLESALDIAIPEKMPYIVGIIDELADLMMVASQDIETPIARIAQMARAVGIHLILATQRPSREVITGLIKANFPTRISFKVASRVNSQIVLDEIGADSLLGNGDMLFLPPGTSHLLRAQGAYIRDEDIAAVVKYINQQAPPQYIIQSFKQSEFTLDNEESNESPADSLYEQALDTILSTGNASTTFLQRKLKIGYARAASLIDQLESRGVVGPTEGAKPRKILISTKVKNDEIDGEL